MYFSYLKSIIVVLYSCYSNNNKKRKGKWQKKYTHTTSKLSRVFADLFLVSPHILFQYGHIIPVFSKTTSDMLLSFQMTRKYKNTFFFAMASEVIERLIQRKERETLGKIIFIQKTDHIFYIFFLERLQYIISLLPRHYIRYLLPCLYLSIQCF